MTLDALRAAGKPVLLIFSDPNCGPCNALLPDVGRWQQAHLATLTLAVITRGTAEANRAKSAERVLIHVLLQSDREVARAYQSDATPTAVLVNADGTVGSPLAPGAEAIRALVERTTGPSVPAPMIPLRRIADNRGGMLNGGNGHIGARTEVPRSAAPQVGDPAPALRLPDLEGTEIDLASLVGEPTVVLFWNPSCGYCARMLDDVQAWDAASDTDAPRLVVISAGDIESNKQMGLRSPSLSIKVLARVAHSAPAARRPPVRRPCRR